MTWIYCQIWALMLPKLLLYFTETWKHTVIFIGEFLVYKHHEPTETDDDVSSNFLEQLNRGSLPMPPLSTVYFVHCRITWLETLSRLRNNCDNIFRSCCTTLTHLFQKIVESTEHWKICWANHSRYTALTVNNSWNVCIAKKNFQNRI